MRHNGAINRKRNPQKVREASRRSARKAYLRDPAASRRKSYEWRQNNLEKARGAERRRYQMNKYGKVIDDMTYRDAARYKNAVQQGYRSGFEVKIAKELEALGVDFKYEPEKLKYTRPSKTHTYTPDILLPNGVYVELKGYWATADRQKMALVTAQNPGKDIRIVFSNPKQRISKTSSTTYAMWADKIGLKWAEKSIPKEWLAA